MIDTPDVTQFDAELDAYAALSRPSLNSVLVLQQGRVLSEHYWRGFSTKSYQPIYSITKSVVSALVGCAIADGKLTLSDTLAYWFPEFDFASHSRTASVTVQHLLTMSAGFQKPVGRIPSDNLIPSLLGRKSASVPGEKFHYVNEDVDLLAILLERAIGEPVTEYAVRRLFSPLGIWRDVPKSNRKRLWKTDRQGHAKGGAGLHLSTPELALLGQLYLQNGRWEDVQLLPVDYVTATTSPQSSGGYPERLKYGYLWWIATDYRGNRAFFASGAGGQYVYVQPADNLVTVITTTLKRQDGRPHRVTVVRLINKLILSH